MFPESHDFIAMAVTGCIKDTCFNLSQSNIVKGDEIVRSCDRHSNETVTLKKHVTRYKHMLKWMVQFFRKFENRGIKIAGVKSFLITLCVNLV